MAEPLSTHYTFAVKPESLSSELSEMSTTLAKQFPQGCTEHLQTTGNPDLYVFAMYEGALTARCSLWIEPGIERIKASAKKTGFIGHYAATEDSAGEELLDFAEFELKKRGCGTAIGPVDGSTWKRYRLVTQSSGEKYFPLEPVNPLKWNQHFLNAGYSVAQNYGSSINRDLSTVDPEARAIKAAFRKAGVRLRSLNMENLLSDLQGIHQVTMSAMKSNFLFSPIEQSNFVREYGRLASMSDPDLVVIAELDNQIVGYLFAYPDPNAAPETPRLIMKTIARLPDEKLKGLGRLLFQEVHARAHEKGFNEAIHALYARGNRANGICDKYGETFRNYAVYGKNL